MLSKKYEKFFDIGCAINPQSLAKHKDFICREYNSITVENEMKLERIMSEEGKFNFEFPDRVVEYVKEHNMRMRGHTLVWHNQNPDWLFKDNGQQVSKEVLKNRMHDYFNIIMNRYGKTVYAWDVVNEAIEDKSGEFLRQSPWLSILGENYLYEAFCLAHEVDSKAQLFYNDYNTCHPEKREKIYRLVRSLKEQGAPVHGIGMQGHWNIYEPSIEEIRKSIEMYASLDVRLQITELDLSVFAFADERVDLKEMDEKLAELQAKRYEDIFKLFREYYKEIDAVTFWGVADDYTWLDNFPVFGRKNWPLLFDKNLQPKESYKRIMEF